MAFFLLTSVMQRATRRIQSPGARDPRLSPMSLPPISCSRLFRSWPRSRSGARHPERTVSAQKFYKDWKMDDLLPSIADLGTGHDLQSGT